MGDRNSFGIYGWDINKICGGLSMFVKIIIIKINQINTNYIYIYNKYASKLLRIKNSNKKILNIYKITKSIFIIKINYRK